MNKIIIKEKKNWIEYIKFWTNFWKIT
jgi:hypothetical protein